MTASAHPAITGAQVLVTVGTDHHRFDRLVQWADRWAAAHPDVDVLVQCGTTAAPKYAQSVPMLGYDEMVSAMSQASVVVAHGGPATTMDARSVGHRPIVVPRSADHGEHVDNHQVTFTRWMADREIVWLGNDEAEVHALIDSALADPTQVRISPTGGAAPATLAAFDDLMRPLLAERAGQRSRQRRDRRRR